MAKKVFIVEDDEFLRSLTVKRLGRDGFEVDVASKGEGAVEAIKKAGSDLVLLDLLLPGLSGFDVLKEIRADAKIKSMPVIVFSNLGQREDIEKAKVLGISDFLIKANFTLDDVAMKVSALLK